MLNGHVVLSRARKTAKTGRRGGGAASERAKLLNVSHENAANKVPLHIDLGIFKWILYAHFLYIPRALSSCKRLGMLKYCPLHHAHTNTLT